jgi:hypothetical protein
VVVISYRSFGKTFGFLTPEDGTDLCPETSVIDSHYSLRNSPEECSFYFFSVFDTVSAEGELAVSTRYVYGESRSGHGQLKFGSWSRYGQVTFSSKLGHGLVTVRSR